MGLSSAPSGNAIDRPTLPQSFQSFVTLSEPINAAIARASVTVKIEGEPGNERVLGGWGADPPPT
jgi:hypothetical protein